MVRENKAQMKIAQMIFMILAVFLFFILVGLFLLNVSFSGIKTDFASLQRNQAISSLRVISGMSELSCDSSKDFCLDEDKLQVMSGNFSNNYSSFWPVASIKVYKIVPDNGNEIINCPSLNCNYYEIYDNGQRNREEVSTYVSLCKKNRISGVYFESCEIAKLVVGRVIRNE